MYDKRIIVVATLLMSFLAIEIKATNHEERPIINLLSEQPQEQQHDQVIRNELSSNSKPFRYLAKAEVTDDDDLVLFNEEEEDDGDNDTDDDEFDESDNLLFKKNPDDTCVSISTCELCHGGKRGGHEGCSATGKRVKSKCIVPDGNGYKMAIQYKPCNRTPMDEEYVMIQFQAICLFVAFISLRAVKREKIVSASLFDLRTRRRLRQEMVPLTKEKDSSANLDVDDFDTV
mmetsp:Transcript_2254/g.2726  ORF Transcript_2254/g.2726 Transcript_2254/m.2726 type:complete len:231 (-) Transcript_2254:112-804(-)|eukprot:CAMPEP_0203676194 /NCGR_PEP_ID=MMETSP0090-20130426/23780_1 /ASSEMBLY_ACC=CAM_ASM_001088 /TAXON_ID=426623 /ORGANISM="Chaetoceros affinis, Strain CCMP159" /LENGTH=230 /DNA_ID=CAMNT_0050542665 /DNA_START=51 /DNA_END=743 /DNA_ORIENTATION=+